jgi:small-conductance mechanosensitive channel
MGLLSACCLGVTSVSVAEVPTTTPLHSLLATLEQQLQTEEQQLQADTARQGILTQRLTALQSAQQITITPPLLTKSFLNRLATFSMMQEAEAGSLELTIKTAQMEAEATQSGIYDLHRRNLDMRRNLPLLPEIEDIIRQQTTLLELQQKRVRVLQNTRDILSKNVSLTKEWCKHLQIKSQPTAHDQYQAAVSTLIKQLHHTQKVWIDQLASLGAQMSHQEEITSITQMPDLITLLQSVVTEEKNNSLRIQLDLERMGNELQTLSNVLIYEPPLMVLNTLQKPLEGIVNHLQLLEDLLKKKYAFLQDSSQLASYEKPNIPATEWDKLKRIIVDIQQRCNDYQKQSQQVEQLIEKAQTAQGQFTRQLRTYLSSRQDLPGLDAVAWLNVVQQLKEIPTLLAARLTHLLDLVVSRVQLASWIQSSLVVLITLVWIRVLILIQRFAKAKHSNLSDLPSDQVAQEGSPTLFGFFLKLLNQNVYSLVLCLAGWNVLLIWKIPLSAFLWLFNLLLTNIIFGVTIKTCHVWLLDNVSEENRASNRRLYYRLYSILSIGRVVTLFSLVVHQLVLDYEVRNLVARLFMTFLFIIALVLLRMWALVPKLLEGYWAKRPRYLKQVIQWFSFLLPMTLLLNAILGLIGYVQLAWALVGYQSVLLLALGIYPFIKALLNECFSWLSEQSIRHLRNGWLWSEALLKPLYQLLKLVAFVSIIVLLFDFAGWREELLTWISYPRMWFNKPLITILDIPIDTWKIIQVIAMSVFVAWLARWTREFAYRWVFANIKDLGLRNSLSVFAQYMAIFLAILSTLQIVGLTLSILKYVLSGFAIGLSFGLRDLFNNFVTGIFLLVERPVKVGDWVTVGDYDGQVVYIGARAITINTEDRQELMVPNADLFYKHFINWTRHDSIVRLTLPLLINRQDDPVKVRELILEVIGAMPKILKNPAPEVYFKATDQILLSFKIEYYVDLTQITSRSDVNSQFLFALWKRFAEVNIMPPEVVHELRLTGQLGLDHLPKVMTNA